MYKAIQSTPDGDVQAWYAGGPCVEKGLVQERGHGWFIFEGGGEGREAVESGQSAGEGAEE